MKTAIHTQEEIVALLNASDLKEKVVILLMCSAGLRVGALPTLLLKHLKRWEMFIKLMSIKV